MTITPPPFAKCRESLRRLDWLDRWQFDGYSFIANNWQLRFNWRHGKTYSEEIVW